MQRYIVGVSGASGMPLAKMLLQTLYQYPNIEVHVIISEGAQKVLQTERPNLNCVHKTKPQLCGTADVSIENSSDALKNYSSDIQDFTGLQTKGLSDLQACVLAGLQAGGLSGTPTQDLSGTHEHDLTGTPTQDLSGTPAHDLSSTPAHDLSGTPEHDLTGTHEHDLTNLTQYAHYVHDVLDLSAGPASGSWKHSGMIICPCSMSSLASIASGAGQNLLHRAADVCIKESRPLILVPRETPLSTIHLQNMLTLSKIGVKIMPPCPAFYGKTYTLESIIEHFIARILDQLKIKHNLGFHWKG